MKTYTVYLSDVQRHLLHPQKAHVDADYFEVEDAGSLVFYQNLPDEDEALAELQKMTETPMTEPVPVRAFAPETWKEVTLITE